MNNINLKIKNSNGMFYSTAKEPTPGYVENTYTDKKTKTTVTNYHKEVSSIVGVLKSIRLKDSDYGKRVVLRIEASPEETIWLELGLFDVKKRINPYVKSLCNILENVRFNIETEISLNRTNKDKAGYLYRQMYMKQGDSNVRWAFKLQGEESPIPSWKQVADKVTGELSWDSSDQDKFYYDLIVRYTQETVPAPNAIAPVSTGVLNPPVSTETPSMPFTNDNDVEDEDLPF